MNMMMMMMMLKLVYKGLGNSLTLGGCPLLRRQPDLHHLHTQYPESNFLQASLESARVTNPFSKIPTSSLDPSSTTALQYIHPPANIALSSIILSTASSSRHSTHRSPPAHSTHAPRNASPILHGPNNHPKRPAKDIRSPAMFSSNPLIPKGTHQVRGPHGPSSAVL